MILICHGHSTVVTAFQVLSSPRTRHRTKACAIIDVVSFETMRFHDNHVCMAHVVYIYACSQLLTANINVIRDVQMGIGFLKIYFEGTKTLPQRDHAGMFLRCSYVTRACVFYFWCAGFTVCGRADRSRSSADINRSWTRSYTQRYVLVYSSSGVWNWRCNMLLFMLLLPHLLLECFVLFLFSPKLRGFSVTWRSVI